MNARTAYLAAIVVCSFCASLQADKARAKREATTTLFQELRSEDHKVRSAAWLRLLPQREETVSLLMVVLSHWQSYPNGESAKLRAIELLGEYRAAEAAGLLVDEIDWPGADFVRFPDPLGPYPAAKAILRIGDPAIREILESRMGQQATDQEFKLFAYVLWYHYAASDQEVGLFRMQRLLERWKAERARHAEKTGTDRGPDLREQNLARLIETYQTINPRGRKDWPGRTGVRP